MAGDAFTAAIFRWLNAVAADPTLPPAAFKLGYIISQHINRQSKKAWPSQETLRESIGLKDARSVRRLTDAMEARGFLITQRRKQSSMVYSLSQDRTELSYQDEHAESVGDARPDISDRSTDQDRTFLASRPDNFPHQDRTELSAKPLIEPLKEPERERRARAKALPRDFSLDRETQEWAEGRLGSDAAVQASMFRFENHHRAKGSRFVDWMAKARLWIDEDAQKTAGDKSVVAAADRLLDKVRSFDVSPDLTDEQWDPIVERFAKTGIWTMHVRQCGNAPPAADCRAPRHLLVKHGVIKEAAA